jgi:hypothetical protein
VLGVKHRMIVGYRGGNDVFLAMQRNEVQFHSTSISTFRGRNAAFVKSGDGVGIAYLVPVDRDGAYDKSRYVTEMPAFPDLYKEVHGKLPSGPDWDALNWHHQPDRRDDLCGLCAARHATGRAGGAARGLRGRLARSRVRR